MPQVVNVILKYQSKDIVSNRRCVAFNIGNSFRCHRMALFGLLRCWAHNSQLARLRLREKEKRNGSSNLS